MKSQKQELFAIAETTGLLDDPVKRRIIKLLAGGTVGGVAFSAIPACALELLAESGNAFGTVMRFHEEVNNPPHNINVILPPDAYSITSDYNSKYGSQGFTRSRGRHSGIDITAPVGTPVLTTSNGKCTYSSFHDEHGNKVTIQASGLGIVYGHLDERYVKIGDIVKQGQVIGVVGQTGTTAVHPHLHLSVINSFSQNDNPHTIWAGGPGIVVLFKPGMTKPHTYPIPGRNDVGMFKRG